MALISLWAAKTRRRRGARDVPSIEVRSAEKGTFASWKNQAIRKWRAKSTGSARMQALVRAV